MEHQVLQGSRRFSAFISYSHADRPRAARLQRRIESYRFPAPIAARLGTARLAPVFMDRGELPASDDLGSAIEQALLASANLIVLCTPAAANSAWVASEIAFFRRHNRSGAVLAALFEGSEADAFPPGLAGRTAQRVPLAADFRAGGDGKLALLKLIAAIADIELDQLVRRDALRRRKRLWLAAAGTAAIGSLLLVLGWTAYQASAAARKERARLEAAASYQLGPGRAKVEAGLSLDQRRAASEGVDQLQVCDLPTKPRPLQVRQCAEHLHQQGDTEQQDRNFAGARRLFAKAYAITAAQLEKRTSAPDLVYAHGQSEFYLGSLALELDRADEARSRFLAYRRLARRFNSLAPRNPDGPLEIAYAESNLGTVELRTMRNPADARRRFLTAQTGFERALALSKNDPKIAFEVADGESWLSNLERTFGDYRAAEEHRRKQKRILDGLARAHPRNMKYRAGLVVAEIGFARIAADQGRWEEAARHFGEANRIVTELAQMAPDNPSVERQKRAVELSMARTWLSMPPARRPKLAAIGAAIGDCAREWDLPDNNELAALCSLQSSRLALASGRPDQASARLDAPKLRTTLETNALSPRWRFDLINERNSIARTITQERAADRGG